MNIEPMLYDENNLLQQQDAKYLFELIEKDLRDRTIEVVVDVGCGTGNITVDIQKLTNCERLIAFDKSNSMIDFARKKYQNNSIKFEVGDICDQWSKLASDINFHQKADLVVSIHCLHWVKDKRKAVENISKMLKPGGTCYILMFFWSDILPLQEQLTHFAKWSPYFAHLETKENNNKLLPEKQRRRSSAPFPVYSRLDEEEVVKEWHDVCKSANLEESRISIRKSVFNFDTFSTFQNETTSLCHFLRYIPEERKEEFLADYFDHIYNCYIKQQGIYPKVDLSYECISITAKKSNIDCQSDDRSN